MSVPKRLVVIDGFYARDGIRGRTHIRKVTSIYGDSKQTWVKFLTYNLVGKKNPQPGETTMASFLVWADRVATGPEDVRHIH